MTGEPLDLAAEALEKFDVQIRAWRSAGKDYAPIKTEHLAAVVAEVKRLRAQIAAVEELADKWEHGALRWADPLPVPPAVNQLREALGGAS